MRVLGAFGILACALGVSALATGSATAGTYVVSETVNHVLACYDKIYVPATVQYNTRGILVQHESVGWEINGDRWQKIRYPAVYIETRKVLESDHYKLVPCP